MTRNLVTRAALSEWFTSQVQAQQGCEDATVSVQYRLAQPDTDGCNWSNDFVINPGSSTVEAVQAVLRRLLPDARKNFNVTD